ncbi:MAG: nucleoside 2-deoxyribosyltransferase [Brevinema sp.]
MQIYIAAPLFNPRELAWNQEICTFLEDRGYDVFLPQRDGGKSAELEASSEEAMCSLRQGIFDRDFLAVSQSDFVLFITDGAVLDVGACAEVGIAKALNIPVIAFHQDVRSFINGKMNLFVEGCISEWVSSFDELEAILKI